DSPSRHSQREADSGTARSHARGPAANRRAVRRRTARQLTALVDGSLQPERRAAVLWRVWASPKPTRALEEQRFALEIVRELSTPAPASLRSWLERRAACATTR